MNKIVVDIETIGVDFGTLDEKSQEYLLKFAQNEEEKEKIKNSLALYPLTGEIVAIGMLNPDTNQGSVFFQNNGGDKENFKEDNIFFETGSENEILEKFWEAVRNYNQVVTFNGRGFDAPYLYLRSAILKTVPSKNIMAYRYDYKTHCDLLDQLTFYGATRRFSLHFYAKAFGIKSPKEDGIDGLEIGKLYEQGKFKEIARYCVGDLTATKELYEYWDKYLRF
jgi:DNA polymerase elongation subunit (family B)